MPRAKDLDIIAPDDIVVENKPLPKPKKVKKVKKKTKKISHVTPSVKLEPPETPKLSNDIRQKVYTLAGTTSHSLSSFLARPKVFSFQEKEDEEEIIVVLRQHWFTNVSWILTAILMAFLPLLLGIIPLFSFLPYNYQFVAIVFWYLIVFMFAFEKFLTWYFNVYIITDERIIDIDFYNLLDKKFSEAKLSMIQDVTSRVSGLSQTIFNYGNVLIQTAAEITEICFEKVPDPPRVIKILQQLRQEEELEAIEGRVR